MVKKYEIIGRSELQERCGNMPISTYNKLKPYLEEEYQGILAYDKSRKIHFTLVPVDKKHVEQLVEMGLITQ